MARPPFGVLLVTGGMTHQENYGAGFLADPVPRSSDSPMSRTSTNAATA